MKLTTALILPTLALANPLAVRQEDRAKFIGQFRTEGNGCPAGSVSVALSREGQFVNEFATVTLRSYRVQVGPTIPPTEQNKQCRVFLDVRFPLGCQAVTFGNTLTGAVQLDPGATGTYQRAYVLPTAQLTGNRPADLQFTSANFPDYIQNEGVAARVTVQNEGQRTLPYSLEGGLSLQRGPNNNANATLSNDVWSVGITQQARCCKPPEPSFS